MNAKSVILGLISMALIFAITKDITFAVAIFVAETLLWHVMLRRRRANLSAPPSIS